MKEAPLYLVVREMDEAEESDRAFDIRNTSADAQEAETFAELEAIQQEGVGNAGRPVYVYQRVSAVVAKRKYDFEYVRGANP